MTDTDNEEENCLENKYNYIYNIFETDVYVNGGNSDNFKWEEVQ